jgi:hypothetical protein
MFLFCCQDHLNLSVAIGQVSDLPQALPLIVLNPAQALPQTKVQS